MSTIAAIATSLGNSGINIIRISGENSLNVITKVFTNYAKLKPNKIIYGRIFDCKNIIDNVLVSYFKAPNSFTGEDVVEINCHGGTFVVKTILELLIDNGASLATPGEFSKRAFLNGKMDLTEAEAVIDLINSRTKIEARIANSQLQGEVSNKIFNMREKLIEMIAHIEVSVDYPEYDYEEIQKDSIVQLLSSEIQDMQNLINSYEEGKYIKNGLNVAILGRPNVGKSSILNKLANYERAIVTDIEGTTRDIVEETINIGNVILNISDTAGIRNTEDVIEKIGVSKSIKKIEEVDFVIYVLSADSKVTDDDVIMLSKIKNNGVKYIVAINKMDKSEKPFFDGILQQLKDTDINNVVQISIKEDMGIQNLKDRIIAMFFENDLNSSSEIVIVNERHKTLLKNAFDSLIIANSEILKDLPLDLIAVEIKQAAKKLGEIIGLDVSVDIINKIFEKFCLGK